MDKGRKRSIFFKAKGVRERVNYRTSNLHPRTIRDFSQGRDIKPLPNKIPTSGIKIGIFTPRTWREEEGRQKGSESAKCKRQSRFAWSNKGKR